jgi:hypothetical protein
MDEQPPPAPPPATGPRLLLGAFIVWQLLFLVGINFVEVLEVAREELPAAEDPHKALERVLPGWATEEGHFHDLTDVAGKVTKRYAQLTCSRRKSGDIPCSRRSWCAGTSPRGPPGPTPAR